MYFFVFSTTLAVLYLSPRPFPIRRVIIILRTNAARVFVTRSYTACFGSLLSARWSLSVLKKTKKKKKCRMLYESGRNGSRANNSRYLDGKITKITIVLSILTSLCQLGISTPARGTFVVFARRIPTRRSVTRDEKNSLHFWYFVPVSKNGRTFFFTNAFSDTYNGEPITLSNFDVPKLDTF